MAAGGFLRNPTDHPLRDDPRLVCAIVVEIFFKAFTKREYGSIKQKITIGIIRSKGFINRVKA